MRAPIVQRPVTGARRIPRRRRPRGARTPLRRPLALLYRQSRNAPAAAAAVRAADGRSVPLAPRLQIALHLSLTFNEQHPAFAGPATTHDAPPAERKASTSRRLIFAARLRRLETRPPTPGEARTGSPPRFSHAGARTDPAQPRRPETLVYTHSIGHRIAVSSGGHPGPGTIDPTAHAGIAPPWPLRGDAGAAGAAYIGSLPGHGDLLSPWRTRRPDGAAVRLESFLAVARRTPDGAARRGAGAHVDSAAPEARDTRSRERLVEGRSPVSPRARGGDSAPAADGRADTRPLAADRQRERLILAQAAPPDVPAATAVRATAAAPAGHPPQRPGKAASRLIQGGPAAPSHPPQRPGKASSRLIQLRAAAPGHTPRGSGLPSSRSIRLPAAAPAGDPPQRPGTAASRLLRFRPSRGTALPPLARQTRVALPGAAAVPVSPASRSQAAREAAAALYLAERFGAQAAAPGSFGFAWAPPPLDLRSAAPPPSPPPAEAPAAATPAPSAATVDLAAVSRDVIARIEKRLRVERERRGRS